MDTIGVNVRRPLKENIAAAIEDFADTVPVGNRDWTIEARAAVVGKLDRMNGTGFTARHQPSGLMATGIKGVITRIHCSLPKVLHGTNGICLKYDELGLACDRVDRLLSEISLEEERTWELLRWDFAIQIRCDVPRTIALYRQAKHREIRRSSTMYFKEDTRQLNSIQWCGKDVSISLYDKGAELNSKSKGTRFPKGEVLRLEVSLKNKAAIKKKIPASPSAEVRKLFPNQPVQFHLPGYFVAWRIFREVICQLDPPPTESIGQFSLLGLIAECERADLMLSNGMTALEWYGRHRDPDTLRKTCKKVEGLKRSEIGWRLDRALPLNAPPELVDLHLDGRMEIVPSPFLPQHLNEPC